MNINKIFTNSKGFTIVETVAAIGVIGIISLAIVNQGKLIQDSRVSSSADTALSAIRDRLVVALSNEKTCTTNFANLAMNASTVHTISNVNDSENTAIISAGQFYGGSVTTTKMTALGATNPIKINSISLKAIGSGSDSAELTVEVYKKRGSSTSQNNVVNFDALSFKESFVIPLNIIKNGAGNLSHCFTDSTMSIATAIRLSCRGNTAFYDANLNPPYGACVHIAQAPDASNSIFPVCPTGQFIHKIGINLSNFASTDNRSASIQYQCRPMDFTCPHGMVISGATNEILCEYPVPNCTSGQVMVMSSSGQFICLATNTGCTGLNAIKSFNADGSVTCERFYAPNSCAGFVQSIGPSGSPTCSENVQSRTCPFGQFIKSIDADGYPSCAPWVNFPINCPPNQGAYALDVDGNLQCQPMDKRTSCYGSNSPTGRTFNECIAAGGTVVNRYVVGSTHSFCIFNTPSCPGGWSACNEHRTTIDNSCTDTNSACSYSVQSRTAPGTYSFNDASPSSTTCYNWLRDSGPWVMTCTPVALPPTYASTTQVGCY